MAIPSGLPPRPKGERDHRESAFRWNETKNKTVLRTVSRRNETKNKTVLRASSENRHGKRRRWWLSTNAHNWLRFPARQHLGTRPRRLLASLSSSREQDRETNGLISAPGTRTPSAARQTIESAAESEIGPKSCHIEPKGSRTGNPFGDHVFLGAATAVAYKTGFIGRMWTALKPGDVVEGRH